MTVRTQPSSSSLSRYATAKSPGVDLYNGSPSRDFCNSFWGVGDAGVNILCARMRGAARTTDDLRNFWRERSQIEEEYATKLRDLSKMTLGKDEIGELRNSLDTLKLETEKLATTHLQLASQIRSEMEDSTVALLNKQMEHRRNVQGPLEKKFKTKQSQESYVVKAREKYQGDCLRIASYTQQIGAQGKDVERIQVKLKRAQQTVQANEQDFASFSQALTDFMPGWEADWKDFCDACQDLEEERLDFMKDTLWAYANAVSTICVNDDLSCETIRTVLDQLEPERDMENFVSEYGTGNSIPEPPKFVPYTGEQDESSSSAVPTHPARFSRKSKRAAPAYQLGSDRQAASPQPQTQPPAPTSDPRPEPTRGGSSRAPPQQSSQSNGIQLNDSGPSASPYNYQPTPSPAQNPRQNNPDTQPPATYNNTLAPERSATLRRVSQPLPEQPQSQPHDMAGDPSPTPPTNETGGILFYVKALYDYTATIDEEFDFQSGDVIAVTATPDDGWWSGELLDEARREEGRHIFPSNFVCLF